MKYGVEESIMLNYFEICVKKNMANEQHQHDGKYWFYMSIKAFTKIYPFWSEKQIRRILKSLKEQGAIVEGVFNKNKYDQTKWYTLGDCSCPNGQIDDPKRANENDQTGKPIPSNNPCTNPYNSDDDSVYEKEEPGDQSSSNEPDLSGPASPAAIDFYQQNFGMISPFVAQQLDQWAEDMDSEVLISAMKIAVNRNKRTMGYVNSILKDWFSHNVRDLEQAKAYEIERKSPKSPQKNNFKSKPRPEDGDVPDYEESMIALYGENWREERNRIANGS
ncbi:MAG: DnaD domain-containing protein [Sporolactobacillus sp.]